jgi:hypothetical protein
MGACPPLAKLPADQHGPNSADQLEPRHRAVLAPAVEVRNLDRIRIGDTVNALYQERTTYVLSEAGANRRKGPGAREVVVATGAPKGQDPSAIVTREEVANYIVIGTNVQANTMTLVPVGGGPVFERDIVDPTARATLPRVKPGNYLTVIERETLVAEVSAKP